MNFAMICRLLGIVLEAEAAVMLPALGIALARSEPRAAAGFAAAMGLLLLAGALLRRARTARREYYAREGFVTVGLAWLLLSLFGALPFYISGAIPAYLDCFFETVAGFTTTGTSILPDVEALPRSLLYWRSFTNWLGGMGVLVFVLAVSAAPGDSGETLHLLRAEFPGIKVNKLVPRMRRSTSILYLIYIGITVLMFLLLLRDMPVFDALTTAFATTGTGGFSVRRQGMAAYSRYSQTVVLVFMMLSSVNFSVYYLLLLRRFRRALHNEELWTYLALAAGAVAVVAFNIRPVYGSLGEALHASAFTVASVISTSGFALANYDAWPWLSRMVLLLLMFVGACAGSTGGGLKVVRVLLAGKIARRGIYHAIRPQEVRMLHLDGEVVDEDTANSVSVFFLVYMFLCAGLILLLALDGRDFVTTVSAAVSCFNNVGLAMGDAGPMQNFSCFSAYGKLLLCAAMLLGRLELYPLLMLFLPAAWRK